MLIFGQAWRVAFRKFAPFVHLPVRNDESIRFHRTREPMGSIRKSLSIGETALQGFVWVFGAPFPAVGFPHSVSRRVAGLNRAGAVVGTVSRCKTELSMRDSWESKIHGE